MLSSQRGRCSVWMNHPWLPPDKQYGGKLCGRARWNGSLRGHKRMIEISAWPSINSHVRQSIERSEEHTSELQSLMRISYAVFCLKKQKNNNKKQHTNTCNAETLTHTNN